MFGGFRGGIHPDDQKQATAQKPISPISAPEQVILPLSMHIGVPAKALVAKGDSVRLGQKIGEAQAAISAPVHATVSGTVAAVEPRLHPNGTMVLSVVIDSDGENTLDESVAPAGTVESLSAQEIVALIREAGIVGLGGAAFPTAAKLTGVTELTDTVILNGAECEPYITADNRLLLEQPEEVISGIRAIQKVLEPKQTILAMEENKPKAIERVKELLKDEPSIQLSVLHTRYPQGAEKQLIKAVTGREVRPGSLPSSVGCAIFNVGTCAAIHRAVTQGMPLTTRVVTVSGSAVANPQNLLVPIGTPVSKLLEECGGFVEPPKKVIMGGPMMGHALPSVDVPVIKGTNAILAFCGKEYPVAQDPVCIRCGKCVSVCPMHLTPNYMYAYERRGKLNELEALHVTDCMECGCCAYVCPGRLFLVQSFRSAKQQLAARKRKQ